MNSTPEEIAHIWREQMHRGYLKLAILLTLTRGPLHGYHMMKRINELTLGIIKPTAGGMYPTLRELEEKGLIEGEWHTETRRKVYKITSRGKEVFREIVEKHLDLASSIRNWILKALVDLDIIEDVEIPPVVLPAVRVLLLNEKASTKQKIEALEKLAMEFRDLNLLLITMVKHVDERIMELKSK